MTKEIQTAQSVSQIGVDHGELSKMSAVGGEGALPPLAEGMDLEAQLKQGRRMLFNQGVPNPEYAALAALSLDLAGSASAGSIREGYEAVCALVAVRDDA